MKKTLLTILLGAFAVGAYAQGTVIFATTATASTKTSTNSVVGGTAAGLTSATAGSYYYALFYSTTGATTVSGAGSTSIVGAGSHYVFNDANWTFVSYGANGAAGKFASSGTVNSDGTTTIPTVAAAGTAELVVVGWSANIGSTWQSVQTYLAGPGYDAWVGESAVASIVLGNAPGTAGSQSPISLFGTGVGQVGGLLLGQVQAVATPEPGTMALAALGGASMLLFLRRK